MQSAFELLLVNGQLPLHCACVSLVRTIGSQNLLRSGAWR